MINFNLGGFSIGIGFNPRDILAGINYIEADTDNEEVVVGILQFGFILFNVTLIWEMDV